MRFSTLPFIGFAPLITDLPASKFLGHYVPVQPKDLELIRVVLVHECDRYAHNALVIHRDIGNSIYIDGIEVIVAGVSFIYIRQRVAVIVIVPMPQIHFLVAFLDIEIREPQLIAEFLHRAIRLQEFLDH